MRNLTCYCGSDLVVVVGVAGRVVVAAVAVVAVVVAVAAEHSNFGSTLPKHYNLNE